MTDKVISAIDIIRKRPGMYLGSLTLTPLFYFLHGYDFARRDLSCEYFHSFLPLDFRFFSEYTCLYYHRRDSAGWCNHILEYCGGDEEKALSEFFEIFDKFKEIRVDKIWRAALSVDNILYNNCMEHCYSMCGDEKSPIYTDPICVYIFGLSVNAFLLAVETKTEFEFSRWFFSSYERASGGKCILEGAEVYFGKIDGWEELNCIDDIDKLFGNKKVNYNY